jgi:signal transduction histidine kinase
MTLNPTRFGLVVLGVVVARAFLYYRDRPDRPVVFALLAVFSLLYLLEPALSARFARYRLVYFPAQTTVLLVLAGQDPFLDVLQVLYIPLGLQATHAFSPRPAAAWLALFAACLNLAMILALGWAKGLAFSLLIMAAGTFLLSYDRLGAQMQRDRDESQRLLAELQAAHRQLEAYAGRAEALAAARERNWLARELHDSVSQSIFAIRLTSQATRLLQMRDPARVSEQLDRLQRMTATTLGQLRSLIAQLRPPPVD